MYGGVFADKLPLKIDGLDLDSVYENFVRQIAGGQVERNVPELKRLRKELEEI